MGIYFAMELNMDKNSRSGMDSNKNIGLGMCSSLCSNMGTGMGSVDKVTMSPLKTKCRVRASSPQPDAK